MAISLAVVVGLVYLATQDYKHRMQLLNTQIKISEQLDELNTAEIIVKVEQPEQIATIPEPPNETIIITEPTGEPGRLDETLHPDVYCLAKNAFFEASIDNLAGMAAVADVVLNRVEDTRYPNTVCGVIQAGKKDDNGNPIKNRCAFSWYCDGKDDDVPRETENWKRAKTIAWNLIKNGKYRGISDGATHYHATYVKPKWIKDKGMVEAGRIGEHIFYRWER